MHRFTGQAWTLHLKDGWGGATQGTSSAAHLVEERLVQRRVLPLQVVDLFVELGLYVSTPHLKLFQCINSSLHCLR